MSATKTTNKTNAAQVLFLCILGNRAKNSDGERANRHERQRETGEMSSELAISRMRKPGSNTPVQERKSETNSLKSGTS